MVGIYKRTRDLSAYLTFPLIPDTYQLRYSTLFQHHARRKRKMCCHQAFTYVYSDNGGQTCG